METSTSTLSERYAGQLSAVLASFDWSSVQTLADAVEEARTTGRQVFICGNGGSAANAAHIANDLLYPITRYGKKGVKAVALSANPAVLTCLANDVSYDEVFATQLETLAEPGDLLLVLSGSGNSPNVVKALARARELGLRTFAVLGFTGGECKRSADVAIHFAIDDMQIAEDLQLVVGHMVMRLLCEPA